jgi:hypothetical protein
MPDMQMKLKKVEGGGSVAVIIRSEDFEKMKLHFEPIPGDFRWNFEFKNLMDEHGLTILQAAEIVGKSHYTVMAWRKATAPLRPGKTEKARSAYRTPPEAVDTLRQWIEKNG